MRARPARLFHAGSGKDCPHSNKTAKEVATRAWKIAVPQVKDNAGSVILNVIPYLFKNRMTMHARAHVHKNTRMRAFACTRVRVQST